LPTLYTRRAASETLGVSISTLGRLIARGDLAAYRVGVQLRISADAIERYLESHTVEMDFNHVAATTTTTATASDDAGSNNTAGSTDHPNDGER
jgi:excisionase family DNA binding protein